MGEVRKQMGDKPIYISFDIDGLDPAFAPGTGTPEIAGLTPAQVRRCPGFALKCSDSKGKIMGAEKAGVQLTHFRSRNGKGQGSKRVKCA